MTDGLSGLDVTRCTEQFDAFVEDTAKVCLPGKLLFAKLWGSWSHHCALPGSDFDFLAVFQQPTEEFLGLDTPVDVLTHDKIDWQAYELGKFCNLLLSGNPGIIECLFTDEFMISSPVFDQLRAQRDSFLTEQAVNAYSGYAKGQLARLEKQMSVHAKGGEPNEKWAYHFTRLLQDAKRIAQGGRPTVVKTGDERELLMAIRTGRIEIPHVIMMAQASLVELEAMRPWKVQPPVKREDLHRWLIKVRASKADEPTANPASAPN